MKRIDSFDFLRGILMIFIIFFHAAVYNYANIHKIDYANPPIIVVIISFLTLWGGMILFYSGMINTMTTLQRKERKYIRFLFYAGLAYIIINYILNILLGRWANDLVNNKPDMTLIANIIRNSQFIFPPLTKWFEGSSLLILGINLIVLSFLLYLFLNKRAKNYTKQYWILGVSGFAIMLLSFIRVYLYPLIYQSIQAKNYVLALILSYTFANPYPIFPYLAYGLFASMLGMMVYEERYALIKKAMIPIASFFFIYGLIGMLQFEKTISKADYFWYFKTQFELGIFILINLFVIFFFVRKNKQFTWAKSIKNFSTVCLSVYLLEVTLSEVLGRALLIILPSWNQTINGCLLFGFFNVLIWAGILSIWSRYDFKYSFEYYWVLFFEKIGKKSTKLDK